MIKMRLSDERVVKRKCTLHTRDDRIGSSNKSFVLMCLDFGLRDQQAVAVVSSVTVNLLVREA